MDVCLQVAGQKVKDLVGFESLENEINQPYRFLICLVSDVNPFEWEGQRVCLQFGLQRLHGFVSDVELSDCIKLVLNCPVLKMDETLHHRTFVDQSFTQIVETVLAPYREQGVYGCLRLTQPDKHFKMIRQVNETDFQFVMRLFSEQGCCYLFEQGAQYAKWMISDDLKQYSVQTDELDAEQGEGFVTSEKALNNITTDYQAYAWPPMMLSGQTRVTNLTLADVILLKNRKTRWRVFALNLKAKMIDGRWDFLAEVKLIKADLPFQTQNNFKPPTRYSNATVESAMQNSDVPYLNSKGEYRVHFCEDELSHSPGCASEAVTLMTLNRQSALVLPPKTKVLTAETVSGRTVILGAHIPEPKPPRHTFITRTGQGLSIDPKAFRLQNDHSQLCLTPNAATLHSDQQLKLNAGEHIQLHAQNNLNAKSMKSIFYSEKNQHWFCSNGELAITSKQCDWIAETTFHYHADDSLEIKTKEDVHWKVGGKFSLLQAEGRMIFKSEQRLQFHGLTAMTAQSGIVLKNKKGSVKLTPQGVIEFTGKLLVINAPVVRTNDVKFYLEP